jgi:hypothetical protein
VSFSCAITGAAAYNKPMAAATATASVRIALDFTLLSLTAPDFMNRLDKYYRIPAIRPDG